MSTQLSGPNVEDWNDTWERFETADYETRITLFHQAIADGMMDGEMAFEMLSELYPQTIERQERDRFDQLVYLLREKVPEAYAQESQYLLGDVMANALTSGRFDQLSALAQAMADTADLDVDTFVINLNRLAYHGQVALLVEIMQRAWPRLTQSGVVEEWGLDALAIRAIHYIIFNYLEQTAEKGVGPPDPHDSELQQQLAQFIDLSSDNVANYFAWLLGQPPRRWSLADFTHATAKQKPGSNLTEIEENLGQLLVEFVGYARHEEGISYSKASLAEWQLSRYLMERFKKPAKGRKPTKRRRPEPTAPAQSHPLLPTRSSLAAALAGSLDLFSPQPYEVAATFELIPTWLRFLETRGLIDAEQRRRTLSELSGLDMELKKTWQLFPGDPALLQGTEQWRANAGLETA